MQTFSKTLCSQRGFENGPTVLLPFMLFYLEKGWKLLPKLYKVEITNDKTLTIFISLVRSGASPVFLLALQCDALFTSLSAESARSKVCLCALLLPRPRAESMFAPDKGCYSSYLGNEEVNKLLMSSRVSSVELLFNDEVRSAPPACHLPHHL